MLKKEMTYAWFCFLVILSFPLLTFADEPVVHQSSDQTVRPVVGGQQPHRDNIPPGDTTITTPAPAEEWLGYNQAKAITIRKGKAYILNSGNDTVSVRNLSDSTQRTIGFARDELLRAEDIAVDSQGRIFIAGAGEPYLIRAYRPNGGRYNAFGGDGEIGRDGSSGGEENRGWMNIVIDNTDHIYGLDTNNNRIVKISPGGAILGSYTGVVGREAQCKIGCDWSHGRNIFIVEASGSNSTQTNTITRFPLDQFPAGQGRPVTDFSDRGVYRNIVVKNGVYVLAQPFDMQGQMIKKIEAGAETDMLAVDSGVTDMAADKNKKIYLLSSSKVKVYAVD